MRYQFQAMDRGTALHNAKKIRVTMTSANEKDVEFIRALYRTVTQGREPEDDVVIQEFLLPELPEEDSPPVPATT